MSDGFRPIAFFESGRLECRSRLSGSPTVIDSMGKPVETKTVNGMDQMRRAAIRCQPVAEALHFFKIGDWNSLCKVYEIIKADIGGERALAGKAWLTNGMLKIFTQTAQSRDALGDAARHASRSYPAPAKPMSLVQAKAALRCCDEGRRREGGCCCC